jgi:hypothetical protein
MEFVASILQSVIEREMIKKENSISFQVQNRKKMRGGEGTWNLHAID